jgi:multiphosphoryl transfer protein
VTAAVLTDTAIVVGATAPDLDAAIDLVGGMLVSHGCVTPDYVTEMHRRERIMSTYLGNGIALPHGTDESRSAVLRTGLAVAQFPSGVPWGEEPARLVIGLAATSDEHIAVLSRLATVLADEALCERLGVTTEASDILTALTTDGTGPTTGDDIRPRTDEIIVELSISNPAGLHARPAATVVDRLKAFDAEVAIEAGGRRGNARSITALLGLGAAVGDPVRVVARGADARAAADTVVAILRGEEG